MMYSLAADLVLILHLLFIAFALGGAMLVLKWHWLAFLQIPSAIWAALISLFGWICPLTPLEQKLRRAAGQDAYEGGFIAHYIEPVIYPEGLTPTLQILFGGVVIAINAGVYGWLAARILKERKTSKP